MPIFEKPPIETLAPAKDRWTPLYLEHGRLEVDDASVKWISGPGGWSAQTLASQDRAAVSPQPGGWSGLTG